MMKKFAFFIILLALQSCSTANYVQKRFDRTTSEGLSVAVAHRGCWLREHNGEFYIPENSPHGIKMAARYGYPAIELDVKYTLDSVMVVMHDATINRTMRNASDYSKIKVPVEVSETPFAVLREKYVLESSDPSMRTPIPTLEEMLLVCRKTGIIPMLHSQVTESYSLAQRILGNRWIAFSSEKSEMLNARKVSDCLVLWDPGERPVDETLEGLREIGGWCGMSTMRHKMLDASYIRAVRVSGYEVQASIFPSPHEQRALHDGVSIELSDFFWHQTAGRKPVATISESVVLADGQTWKSPKMETGDFAALTIHLNFQGNIEVSVDDYGKTGKKRWGKKPRLYELHRDSEGGEVLCLRLYKTTPSFEIKAIGDASVKVSASVYEL